MTDGQLRSRALTFVLLLATLGSLLLVTSCSTNESKAKKAIEEYLKGHGAKDVTVDVFYVDPTFPDKAYTSATITYDFASAGGKAQREFSGFILAREGNGWRVESNTKYTREQQQAARFLAGGK